MKRILAISDVHGEIGLLEQLLTKANYDSRKDQLILLGDYVDRGSNSMAVVEKVIELQQEGAIVLKGNHEDMMIKALTADDERSWKHWAVRNGGNQTLNSYGFMEEDYTLKDDEVFIKPILNDPVLTKHLNFIQTLHPLVEYGGYIFAHAGVDPKMAIEETDPYRLMWIRDEFFEHYQGDQTVIFGHTPTPNLHKMKGVFTVFFGDNHIIGIDGGAVYGGQLNCLVLPTMDVYSVRKEGFIMPRNNYEPLIPGRIFIGGVDAIDQLLEQEEIDVIYDLRAEVKADLSSEKSVHQPIVDEAANQEQSIKEATKAVMDAYHAGKNIYFHCNTGRGRGGAIATAVLLELEQAKTVEEAEEQVKVIRPVTNIRPEFKEALKNIYE